MSDINEEKQKIVGLLETLEYHTDTTELIKKFISEYDGTKQDDFLAISYIVVLLIMRLQKLEIKGEAFDKLNQGNENFKLAFNQLKTNFERVSQDKEPVGESYSTASSAE